MIPYRFKADIYVRSINSKETLVCNDVLCATPFYGKMNNFIGKNLKVKNFIYTKIYLKSVEKCYMNIKYHLIYIAIHHYIFQKFMQNGDANQTSTQNFFSLQSPN